MLEKYYNAKPTFSEMPLRSITDRGYWDKFRPFADRLKADCPKETVLLPANRYMDYHLNGNRTRFEKLYFTNRRRMTVLALLEAIENKGDYVPDIIDCVWAMLEETTWTLPAHKGPNSPEDALTDPEYQVLDLFQAESGATLAFVYFLMKDKFAGYSKLLEKRIVRTLYDRIIDPFCGDEKWRWSGECGNRCNNWNPWVIFNVLNVAIILKEPAVFPKAPILLENYVKSVYKDGGCDEGPSYWFKAGGMLIYAVENLRKATGIDISDEEMLTNCAEFNIKTNLFDIFYANFADAGPSLRCIRDYLRIARITKDAKLYDFAKALYDPSGFDEMPNRFHDMFDGINLLELWAEFDGKEEFSYPHENSYFVESIQVKTIHRDGFDIAIKGGHNRESHNHNDAGNFIIAKDKELFLIDTGAMEYCKDTFGENRYTIWVNRSEYHNLPEIGGVTQKMGREFAAKDVSHGDNWFEADISGAYGDESIVSWKRNLTVENGVSVTESFEFTKPEKTVLHFITYLEPKSESYGLSLTTESGKTLKMEFDGSFTVDEISTGDDQKLNKHWGKIIYRINIPVAESKSGEFKYRFI